MKYTIILLLLVCAAFALDDLPGWPIATSAYDDYYFGSFVTEHIDYDGTLEIFIAGPDSFIRVLHKDSMDVIYSPPLSGNVRTHIAYGPVSGGPKQIVVITEDGDLYVGNPVFLSFDSPFDPYSVGDSPGPAGPVLWDFDGDNLVEIVVHAGNNLHIFKNDGTELPGFPVAVDSDYGPAASPAVGDMTGDGDAEIIAVGYHKLYAFEHTGDVLFGFPVELDDTVAFSFSSPILLDFDGDGTLEICAGYHTLTGDNRGKIGCWDINGEMLDSWPLTTAGLGSWVYGSAAAGDLDGDGLPEISITSRNGRGYLLNEDASSPTPWSIYLDIGALESSPLLYDFDGDGGPDLFFLGNDSEGTITCFNATGDAIDSFSFVTDTAFAMATPLIIDLDSDGNPEICAIDAAGNIHLYSYPGDGRNYARPWSMARHDPFRTGWLHPEPPDTVIVEAVGDSFLVAWSRSETADFTHYNLYATSDENDSAGGTLLFSIYDTFAVVLPDSGLEYFFVTGNTEFIEGERSMVAGFDTTGIRDSNLPGKLAVDIYPNPFNSSVNIKFSVLGSRFSDIEIFDIKGQKVDVLRINDLEFMNEKLDYSNQQSTIGNQQSATWRPDDDVPSGVYLIKVRGGNEIISRRVVLLR